MKTDAVVKETNDIISRFLEGIQTLNVKVQHESYKFSISRYATDLAGNLHSLQYEQKDNNLVQKINQSIDLTGSVLFWLEFFSTKSISNPEFNTYWKVRFNHVINQLLKLRDETEKSFVQAFPGEWLLCD